MFIRLTQEDKSIYVNTNMIAAYEPLEGPKYFTQIHINDRSFNVLETVQEINGLLFPKDIRNVRGEKTEEEPTMPPETPIEDLQLSVRSYHALRFRQCETIGDILRVMRHREDVDRIRNLGAKSVEEIVYKLNAVGYHFTWE